MKVGDLVKIPDWQIERDFWRDSLARGIGLVLEVTPYAVHVIWGNGEEIAHKTKTAEYFEVINE